MFRSWVEVSRGQIAANYRAIKQAVGEKIEVMPVVKADAYRHGAIAVSQTLVAEGARWLAVSNVEEGIALREAGVTARILVMADFLPFERTAFLEYKLTPAIHSLDDIRTFDQLCQRAGEAHAFHLKVDTGMGRLGARAETAAIVSALTGLKKARFEGLMTHFASAADYASPQTDQQEGCFHGIRQALRQRGFNPEYTHLASTIAVAYGRKPAWGNMVRPGHAIYGYVSPARGDAPKPMLEVKPALAWKATVIAIKDLPEGAMVGYGGMFRTSRPSRIAIIGAGYADGYPHRLSNKGRVIAAGRVVPVLGAVSMDVTTIDVTDCPELRTGGAVTLLGREGEESIDAQQIAKLAGTISYSVLCGISARVKRVFSD